MIFLYNFQKLHFLKAMKLGKSLKIGVLLNILQKKTFFICMMHDVIVFMLLNNDSEHRCIKCSIFIKFERNINIIFQMTFNVLMDISGKLNKKHFGVERYHSGPSGYSDSRHSGYR